MQLCEPPPKQMTNGKLHSALGKPGVASNRLMAGLYFSRSRQRQAAPQIEINHKCRSLLVVTNEIAHETFYDVKVKANGFHTYTHYHYSIKHFR